MFSGQSHGQVESFVRLLIDNERRIYAYIVHLVPNLADADDLMQEVATVLWNKFDTYAPGSDFVAWGIKIAHYCILNFRRKQARSRLQFNSKLIEILELEAGSMVGQMDSRIDALRRCVQKLDSHERELVCAHYDLGMDVKQIAGKWGYSIHQVYRALVRTHGKLMRCVRGNLAMEKLS